jgi:proteasome beta subunit
MLVKRLQAQIKLYELNEKKQISVKALSKMVANILYARKLDPMFVQPVIVGIDKTGPVLYTLDMGGSLIPDDFTAAGSGMQTAYGVLEREYRPDLTVKEAEEVAIRSVKTAIARDVQSGGEIRVMSVTNKGVEERVA